MYKKYQLRRHKKILQCNFTSTQHFECNWTWNINMLGFMCFRIER